MAEIAEYCPNIVMPHEFENIIRFPDANCLQMTKTEILLGA
jgi:hypothetical protein